VGSNPTLSARSRQVARAARVEGITNLPGLERWNAQRRFLCSAKMATVVFGDFEWDDRKAASNQRKHHVTFEEASTIFADTGYLLRPDVTSPDRFHAIGLSAFARVLTVVHIERGPRLRIISARKATGHEKKAYSRRR
jgi:uncharacterized protein